MSKKRIALISFDDIENPQNGYSIRTLTIAHHLKKAGHDIASFQFSHRDKKSVKDDIPVTSIKVSHQKLHKDMLEKMFSFNPFKELIFPFESYAKLRQYRAELETFDEIYLEGCLLIGPFVFAKALRKPVTIDTQLVNKDSAIKMRERSKIVGLVRIVIWHIIEKSILSRTDHVIAISDYDKEFLQKHYHIPEDKFEIIPHIVDPAAVKKYEKEAKRLRKKLGEKYKKIACFIGDLGAIQNNEAEEYIRTQLSPVTKAIHYVLIGNNPNKLKSKENITYTGFVEAVDPYIMAADFCIAPLTLGGGVKTKVLDYYKYQKEVVATPIAVEGLDPSPETLVCERDEFVDKVKILEEH